MSNGWRIQGVTAVRGSSRPVTGSAPIALLLPDLSLGGAERNLVRLAGELHRRGRPVDLVLGLAAGPLRGQLPPGLSVVDLGAERLRSAARPLVSYLRRTRPSVLVATVGHAVALGVWAVRVAGTGTPVVARIATTTTEPSQVLGLRQRARVAFYRSAYGRADELVVNSQGSAVALARFLDIAPERVRCLPNLSVGADPTGSTRGPAVHPWFRPGEPPVVVAVGRLTGVKNHRLLIDAVARLRTRRPVRALILGEGELRPSLEAHVRACALEDAVDLHGAVDDPVPYLRAAALFCLTSDREGMPNALIEALAAGCSVVATDCPSGPRELLDGGRHGWLVPVGDVDALTEALDEALDHPRPAPESSWRAHTIEAGTDAYEELFREVSPTPAGRMR